MSDLEVSEPAKKTSSPVACMMLVWNISRHVKTSEILVPRMSPVYIKHIFIITILAARSGRDHLSSANACKPVIDRPIISECTSDVPSYVFTASRFEECRIM